MILLDMEMPKSCRFCHLQDVCVPFQREVITEVVSIDTSNERHKDCPIKAEIPDNATNGDVIRAMFPELHISSYPGCINVKCFAKRDNLECVECDSDWWNAQYKAESEE